MASETTLKFGKKDMDTARKSTTPGPVAKGDRHLWGIYILLVFIGIIEMYSASSRLVRTDHVLNPVIFNGAIIAVGLGIIWVLQRTHYKKILKWTPAFALVSFGLMVITLIIGKDINSATRALDLKVFTLQPSELMKLAAAAMVAYLMARYQKPGGGVLRNGVVLSASLILVYCALLAPQGLTNTLLLMSISVSMMIIGGVELKKLAIVLAVYVVCFLAYLAVTHIMDSAKESSQVNAVGTEAVSKDNRVGVWGDRLKTYFGDGKPKYEQPLTSDNRQEMLGYMAQAHGGLIGVGPGNSRETARLSLAHTDYIYAIIVEELGFVGGVVVLVLYLWLLGRASAIAGRCSRAFPALLVIGMALTIVFQALFHICIVTGVIPVSGQPLPLISKGGTSVITTSIAFGIMLSVSRFAVSNKGKKSDIKEEIASLPSNMAAENPSQLKF